MPSGTWMQIWHGELLMWDRGPDALSLNGKGGREFVRKGGRNREVGQSRKRIH